MTADTAMDEESLRAFSESARSFLEAKSPLSRLRALRGTSPGFDKDLWRAMAEAGWTAIVTPEALGGLDLGLEAVSAIAQEIGRHPLPEPFIAGAVQAVAALCAFEPSELRDRLLAEVASGDLVIGVAWQEEPGGVEREPLEATASESDGRVRLCGRKEWVAPGPGADGWLVSARSDSGSAVYWLAADAARLRVEPIARVDGTLMGRLVLDDVEIPAGNRLGVGSSAERAIDHGNDVARFAQGAELLGMARQALVITLEYLRTRVQFGRPIGANQALQHRMVDAYIQLELGSAAIEHALAALRRGNADIALMASRVKARCADAALHVTRLAIQFHGAIGYTDEYVVGLYFKRALNIASSLGGAEAHRLRALRLQPAAAPRGERARRWAEFPREAEWDSMRDDEFRAMVRAFLERNYPQHLRYPPRRLHWDEIKDWYFTLSRQGWIAPAWPRAFGGMELPPDKLLAFLEEIEEYGVARTPDQGIINIGPVLIRYGTKSQQSYFLPKIVSGEHIWCQGYSEPNAGSDLASLRTEAVLSGDEFIVNGQKIWTTLAQDATHMFMLVRTDKTAKKQAGISFLLVDLATPGISVKPIRNIAGDEEFCEVFFENVRVPRENLVGELNQGWTVAKSLLGFERIFVGSPQQSRYALNQLRLLAEARGLFDDPAFLSRYAKLQLDVADLSAAYEHYAKIVKRGEALPDSVSILKIWATETYSRISMHLVRAAEEHGGSIGPAQFGAVQVNPLAPLMNATITTIYAGTNEIQRNILAKQVLRLPS